MAPAPAPGAVADAFGPFLARPTAAGIFSDFDGTLSEIVEDPEAACPVAGAASALGALAARFGRAGVISGRPVDFLRQHLGGSAELVLVGLYGMQTSSGDAVTDHADAAGWRPVIARLVEEARADMASGVGVEDKGLALTLHFRTSPERAEEVRRWADSAAARHGLRLAPGRQACELRPPVAVNKGTALAEQAAGLSAVSFVGDDSGDLQAFDALDRLADEGVATVRVAVRNDEAPGELVARADLVVSGPTEVVALFECLDRLAGEATAAAGP